MGKQRSIHNTYLTLPVLVMMVSGHYPMLSNHPQAWLLVGLVIIGGAVLRHALIRHEVGDSLKSYVWTLPVIFITLLVAMVMTSPKVKNDSIVSVESDVVIMSIIGKHCISCHEAAPTHESFDEAPKNVIFRNREDLIRYRDLISQFTVESDMMPIGNETEMTDKERQQLGNWLKAQKD